MGGASPVLQSRVAAVATLENNLAHASVSGGAYQSLCWHFNLLSAPLQQTSHKLFQQAQHAQHGSPHCFAANSIAEQQNAGTVTGGQEVCLWPGQGGWLGRAYGACRAGSCCQGLQHIVHRCGMPCQVAKPGGVGPGVQRGVPLGHTG